MFALLSEDPFLPYSLFPQSDNLYLLHLHEILGALLFYVAVYQWVAPVLNRLIFGKHYTSIQKPKVRVDFDVHTVSHIQCIVTMYVIAPIIRRPMDLNVVTYKDDLCAMASSVTLGYFLWDLGVCILHYELYGLQFMAHCLSSLYVVALTLKPFCLSWAGKFLLFEASTPFVNNNWFITQLSRGASKPVVPLWFNVLNGLLLLAVFFTVRILWGFTAILLLIHQMWKVRDQLPVLQTCILLSLNVTLNSLNVFWFYKMLRIARKMANGSSKVTKSH
ncbi:TDA4 (YJR116W) [Zygosaccharomyces parabailii]|uniref:BN860_01662g1_1 n=1 Tax=Zygosaccharomyces bailii (strain CLIB 213 / ATCC 58445 / CBS 680 / BCRC 21525 / NBRC 1098 / NCYC 1416 / NRRL Y-2227) TaxID=1333698 RepID=A0A8J2T3G1_ZYGB2|nr:TDA4 (YJR116W) [Zygosaccharomyces parabailii]CDF87227.1 BN860_01662g1_1 [Zygosaccharomyces bailii CLIB 213]CDH15705.1 related to Topoisomerase I damage affected protein 4 [Zygosaccharomyces bailii ISA1307]SJM88233.1 related to Topoisomerase I damage affected protein 4 [Zygosaccharomyces bailii]